jgi:hypothetical protein
MTLLRIAELRITELYEQANYLDCGYELSYTLW